MELLKEARDLLAKNGVKKVANLEGMDVKHIRFDDAPMATSLSFIKKAIRYYEQQYGSDDEAAQPAKPSLPLAAAQQLESVVVNVLGKAKRSFEHINLEQLLEKDGLDNLFPAESWPELNAVRDLATEMKAAKKGKSLTGNCVVCYVVQSIFCRKRG